MRFTVLTAAFLALSAPAMASIEFQQSSQMLSAQRPIASDITVAALKVRHLRQQMASANICERHDALQQVLDLEQSVVREVRDMENLVNRRPRAAATFFAEVRATLPSLRQIVELRIEANKVC